MPDPDPHRFVKLVTTTPIAASVLAARLGSEGVVCDVRGPSGSYPIGPAHVYVLEGDLAEAQAVLAIVDDDAADPSRPSQARPPIIIFGALLIVVVLVGISIARVLVVGP